VNKRDVDICYLCGEELQGDVDRDHVPPRQIYAGQIRKRHSVNLFTLPVHHQCNQAYHRDEEYFVHTLAPLAGDTYPGRALWADLAKKWQRPEGRRLGEMIMREFDRILVPGGVASKSCDAVRVQRVLWKIARGLFFKEQRRVLREGLLEGTRLLSPGEAPPQVFNHVLVTQSRGTHPRVFDYKCLEGAEPNGRVFWAYAMLFWDRLIAFVLFHDPACQCTRCRPDSSRTA
jgi:hypothetical protein